MSQEDKQTQITHRDYREILNEHIADTESQTDIRMIHELEAPNPFLAQRDSKHTQRSTLASRTDSKEVQTDAELMNESLNANKRSLSNQSSMDEDSNTANNAPVDRNKLGRRVRRHVKPGCSIAVLPNSEIIIIDPEANCISILDRRGKFKYGMSNSNKPCTEHGHASNSAQFGNAAFGHLPRLDRGVRLLTPQGTLIVKLINESAVVTPTPTPAPAPASQPAATATTTTDGANEATPTMSETAHEAASSTGNCSDTSTRSRPESVNEDDADAPIADHEDEEENDENF